MASDASDDRPLGVTVIAIAFFAASAYLLILASVRFINPDAVSLSLVSSLLHGLELAGPIMFLLAAAVGLLVAIGLLRLKNIARRAAILIAIAGIVMLIPKVSAAATDLSLRFFLAGAMVMARVMVAWYLWQSWTAEKFS